MPLPKCKMPCYWRTWGKYRQTASGKIILNKGVRSEGTCLGSPLVDENCKCTTFLSWEEKPKEYQNDSMGASGEKVG
jgi:hypothetical protein